MGSEVAPEGLVIGPLCAGSGLLLPAGRHAPRRNRSVAIPAAPEAAATNSGMRTATRKASSSGGSGLSMSMTR